MDFAGSRYYRINQILLTCLGLWPYYTQRTKYVYCIFVFLLLLSSIFFQLSSFITNKYSVDLLLNGFSTIGLAIYCTLKYFTTYINGSKLKELMEQVRNDWNSLKEEEELKIIHNRANVGRSCIIALLIWLYSTFFLLVLILISPNILNIVMPLNESRQSWQLPTTMEFFIDREKYIELLTLYLFVTAFIGLSTMISKEMFLLMYVQHTCAMFQITSYRIERTVNKNHTKSLISAEKFNSHKSIVEAIDSHQNVINAYVMDICLRVNIFFSKNSNSYYYVIILRFVDSLKSTFSVTHLFAISIGVASLSINLYLMQHSMVRGSIEHAKMSHDDNAPKYEDFHIDGLPWPVLAVFGRFHYGKTSNLRIGNLTNFIFLYALLQLVSSSLSYFMVIYSVRR
ncbi:uncharacterized protein [Temnothorax longispinosus]|uniref:uncharacterized protein isoform X2 n=1 Tax=Temnothorax longispinosus TaxID=300112 RepID=UPI003A993B41